MKLIIVTADYDDADYVYRIETTNDDTINKFMPLIEDIINFNGYTNKLGIVHHNFAIGDLLRKDLYEKSIYEIYNKYSKEYIDEFCNLFVPTAECGIHTIKSVDIYNISDHKKFYYNFQESDECKKFREDSVLLSRYTRPDGKRLCSIPCKEMSKYEIDLVNRYTNLWLKYRPDLNKDELYEDCIKYQ